MMMIPLLAFGIANILGRQNKKLRKRRSPSHAKANPKGPSLRVENNTLSGKTYELFVANEERGSIHDQSRSHNNEKEKEKLKRILYSQEDVTNTRKKRKKEKKRF